YSYGVYTHTISRPDVPTRRTSDLGTGGRSSPSSGRRRGGRKRRRKRERQAWRGPVGSGNCPRSPAAVLTARLNGGSPPHPAAPREPKGTRLNSSHVKISYAGFCLE